MSLLLAPGTLSNLATSVEKPIDLNLAERFLSPNLFKEILSLSGIAGIRCWASSASKPSLFKSITTGDEVLISQKGTGYFTHYGIIIGKTQNSDFGDALWPVVGEKPWEYIYFLSNITSVQIDKKALVKTLGYSSDFFVPGAILVDESRYVKLETISKAFSIPVLDIVSELDEEKNFYGEDFLALAKKRHGHNKFSKSIKVNYSYACAICGISEIEFLVSAHISPWCEDQNNRLNPQNGICLCTFHDKAFEYGYIGLDKDLRIILNSRIRKSSELYLLLKGFEGKQIRLPYQNLPDITLLNKHRTKHRI